VTELSDRIGFVLSRGSEERLEGGDEVRFGSARSWFVPFRLRLASFTRITYESSETRRDSTQRRLRAAFASSRKIARDYGGGIPPARAAD